MLVALSKLGLLALTTVPLLIVALSTLLFAAEVCTAPAAAIFEGSVNTAANEPAVWAVGWMRNCSPEAGVADTTIDNPSAVSGLATVPAPDRATVLPSLERVREYAPALYAST